MNCHGHAPFCVGWIGEIPIESRSAKTLLRSISIMKTRFIAVALLLAGPVLPASAALTFNISNIGPDASPSASGGAISGSDVDGIVNVSYADNGLDGESNGTITLTLTSLTLDANGVDDDTATITFGISSSGGTINHTTDLGVDGNSAGRINATSEALTFTYISGSVTLGTGYNPSEIGVVDFKGFNGVAFSQFTNDGTAPDDVASLVFGGGSPTNVTTSSYTFTANPDDMTVGFVSGDSPNDGFKLSAIQARFGLNIATVPEPSAALLGGLGLLALLRRRR